MTDGQDEHRPDADPPAARAQQAARAEKPSSVDAIGSSDRRSEVATYELARDELAAVVGKLESGGLSLDDSLSLWERGEHLAALCSRFLEGARERVEAALRNSDLNRVDSERA